MDYEAKLRLLRESIENDKIWQQRAGVVGVFDCPSCARPRVGSYHDEGTGIMLCADCYYEWGKLRIAGKVWCFLGVVPRPGTTQ